MAVIFNFERSFDDAWPTSPDALESSSTYFARNFWNFQVRYATVSCNIILYYTLRTRVFIYITQGMKLFELKIFYRSWGLIE